MSDDRWIWITRWDEFQHYTPERDRAPAWIKTYLRQLDDDRYTNLPPRARSLLHDLRMAFGRTAGQLSDNTLTLSRRIVGQVRRDDLDLLLGAGLIEIVSREVLEQRLEQLYSRSSPRARGRAREEGEGEEELEKNPPSHPPVARDPAAAADDAGRVGGRDEIERLDPEGELRRVLSEATKEA